ncbi:hypothetical protein FOIG_00019 [Fusarium odoratissimum NRRL 54006]|uniref:Uncharacterized protein n=2 Tax=Fusarium oxysporum species complex TaxID=171631 RepID=X0KLW3_FUSO5|nr:uncharacterized protein FOIG_00019 [Fusarium odoratissimum NRRL 54006]EXM09666.1 hypothetical protein FOIG_00019 [Fusarium odoratissimum NRRL 54006]TXC03889.1 hypothetical protein FocTR4_00002120 [Fusarium oxysporum f. sp. cubense]
MGSGMVRDQVQDKASKREDKSINKITMMGLKQENHDGRDLENEPSFDEQDDYNEGYKERPSA